MNASLGSPGAKDVIGEGFSGEAQQAGEGHHHSEMLKVLFTAPRFHTNQHYPVKALLDAGHCAAFFALRRGGCEEYSTLTPHVFGHASLCDFLARLLRVRGSQRYLLQLAIPPVMAFGKSVRAFRPDVVIIRNACSTAFGILSVAAARSAGASVICYTQRPAPGSTSIVRRFLRFVVRAVCGAHWITPVRGPAVTGTREGLRTHYVPFVMPPGTPPGRKRWLSGGRFNIMTVGKMQPRKNHALLLAAVKELARTINLHLTVVGECTTSAHRAEYRRLQTCIRDLGLQSCVDIVLNVPFLDLETVYPTQDLFVLPSSREPAAVSILEAMSHGLPVICSDSNGTRCYIEEGENGYVFRSDDLHDLTKKMRQIALNLAGLAEMGSRSYELVLERHDPRGFANSITDIVGKVNAPRKALGRKDHTIG